MLFRCLYKLAISVKKGKEKILRKFCLWFSCLSSIRISSLRPKQNLSIRKMQQWSKQQVLLGRWTFVGVTSWSKAVGIEGYNSTEDLSML